MNLGYSSICMRSHICWYDGCPIEVIKGDPVYRFYSGNYSRGMHINCAIKFIKELEIKMKGYGRRN